MSEENVEVVREAFDVASNRMTSRLVAHACDPDCRVRHPVLPAGPSGPYRGSTTRSCASSERLVADWAEFEIEKVEAAADSGDWVVVAYTLRREAPQAECDDADRPGGRAACGDTGKIVEFHVSAGTVSEALEAAGLEE